MKENKERVLKISIGHLKKKKQARKICLKSKGQKWVGIKNQNTEVVLGEERNKIGGKGKRKEEERGKMRRKEKEEK